MRVLRGEQEVDEASLRLPDLDEEDEDEEEDDLDGDGFGDQNPRVGSGMQTTMRRPGGPSMDGGKRVRHVGKRVRHVGKGLSGGWVRVRAELIEVQLCDHD